MSGFQRLKKELVREAITIVELLKASGYELQPWKDEHRCDSCPWCGSGHRGKLCIKSQVCYCHSCGNGGDLFEVGGAILGLDVSSHFARILAMCAEVAGIESGSDHDHELLARKREQRKQQEAREAHRRAEIRRRAELGAKLVWDDLPLLSPQGRAYLASRGLSDVASECRSTAMSVCLPLYSGDAITNIVGRRMDGGLPKIRGLTGCGTRATFGRPRLLASHTGPIIVVEGFADYLSARAMSPRRLVLGAHGCRNLPFVAEVAASLVHGTSLGIVLVPHRDEAGRSAMASAREAALHAGLSADAITEHEVPDGCNDLNDELQHKARCAA